jgi:COX assembly protein 1
MTTERLDAAKLDYIANRSEKGRQAVETLRTSRIEKLKGKTASKEERRV